MSDLKVIFFDAECLRARHMSPFTPDWAEPAIAHLVNERADLRGDDLTEEMVVLEKTPEGVKISTQREIVVKTVKKVVSHRMFNG